MLLTIITNNRPRTLLCAVDLPAKAQADFDYIKWEEGYDPRFVQYKGHWYDVDDSQAVRYSRGGSAMTELSGWDLFVSESLFSGVLFKLREDGTVVCGRYYS